jgi:hypothetical protein
MATSIEKPVSAGPKPYFIGTLGIPLGQQDLAKVEGGLIGAVAFYVLAQTSLWKNLNLTHRELATWSGSSLGYVVMANVQSPPIVLPIASLSLPAQAQLEGTIVGTIIGLMWPLAGAPMVVGAATGAMIRCFV